jgi:hypothetical protein
MRWVTVCDKRRCDESKEGFENEHGENTLTKLENGF